jgi:hypothetical protein
MAKCVREQAGWVSVLALTAISEGVQLSGGVGCICNCPLAFCERKLLRWTAAASLLKSYGSSANQADNEEQNDRTNGGDDDCPDEWIANGDGNAKAGEQITRHNRPQNADNDITDKPESATLHDEAGQKTGNGTDNQPDYNALWVHRVPLESQIVFAALSLNTRVYVENFGSKWLAQIGELSGSLKPAPPAIKTAAAENQYK